MHEGLLFTWTWMDRLMGMEETGKRRGGVFLMIAWTTLWAALAVGSLGCGKKYKVSMTEIEYQRALAGNKPVPESTLMVHGEEITDDDIMAAPTPYSSPTGGPAALGEFLSSVARANPEGRYTELARPQVEPVVDQKVSEALLYTKAKSGIPADKLEEVIAKVEEQDWRRFVLQHGGDEAKADEFLREQGRTREDYKESQMRQNLSYVLFQTQTSSKRPITHWELVDAYNKMKDQRFVLLPKIQFKLIDIVADKLELTDSNANPLDAARRLANDVASQLRAGAEFAELARTYSHGIYKDQGGQWPERSPDSFVEPYDQVIEAARSARVGDIVGPVEVPGRFFVLKLDRRQQKGYRPMAEVQGEVENEIRNERFQAAYKEFIEEISTHKEAGETASYIDHCINEAYRRYNED